MTARRRLGTAFAIAGATLAFLATAAIPSASADTCTIAIVGPTGSVLRSFPDVAVPAGATSQTQLLNALVGAGAVTPRSLNLEIVHLTDSCAADTTSTTTTGSSTSTTTSSSTSTAPTTSTTPTTTQGSTTTTGLAPTRRRTTHGGRIRTPTTRTTQSSTTTTSSSTSTTRTSSTPTTSSSSTTTPRPGSAHNERPSSRTTSTSTTSSSTTTHSSATTRPRARGRHGSGHAGSGNPAFSLSLPFEPSRGVPNFFIDSFQIPPFLIPIYQAAGIEYQVPWQVLAAINEIETDYGRNLSISSAGAEGWMQFMPATWKRWGVDANGDGIADPYNPVDAIFSAARYLHAAGAGQNISRAIYAYNHAGWYVQSVLLRAKLIGGIPSQLVGALTGMVQGHFPVAARARYADDSVVTMARHRARLRRGNAAEAVESDNARGTTIDARTGAPVIAVNDGKIVKLGHSAALGNYVALQDATGNTYTYAHLGSVSRRYAAPKPVRITRADVAHEMRTVRVAAPRGVASAGSQRAAHATVASARVQGGAGGGAGAPTRSGKGPARHTHNSGGSAATRSSAPRGSAAGGQSGAAAPMVKVRLFAHPARRASYAAGGKQQLHGSGSSISNFDNYFSDVVHLARGQYTLKRLKVGSIVVGGTILGRIGPRVHRQSPHMYFTIQPAGRRAPDIDPKPILDGWKLLQATAVYRANNLDPFSGPGARRNPSVGQVLLMSKQQLITRTLTDPHARIYACGRRDIQAGTIDRRVLAVIEYLSAAGLDPTVSGLACNASANGRTGVDAAGRTGESLDISAINGTPVRGHQGPGSITDLTIRRLLALQGSMAPDYIVSDMAYKGQSSTIALPDHKNRIQVSFTPDYGSNRKLSRQVADILAPGQWTKLIRRISEIPEPVVPVSPSKYAIREHR